MTDASVLERPPSGAARAKADELFRRGLRLSAPAAGATPDFVAAHALFDLAARQGSIEAKIYRREIEDEMDPAQITDARRLAKEWLTSG
jgi:hypothetical protein